MNATVSAMSGQWDIAMSRWLQFIFALLTAATAAHGQLLVRVSPPKVAGQKAVVPLAMTNGLAEKVESARAVVFLLDEQGRMVAQGTRWVVGGSRANSGLASGATNSFHFVITSDKPFPTTNLTARLTVSRVVLEGGKLADVNRDVKIHAAGK